MLDLLCQYRFATVGRARSRISRRSAMFLQHADLCNDATSQHDDMGLLEVMSCRGFSESDEIDGGGF